MTSVSRSTELVPYTEASGLSVQPPLKGSTGIYGLYCLCLSCSDTGLVRYVGQALDIRRRLSVHRSTKEETAERPSERWVAKNGSQNINSVVLELCTTQDELNQAETRWILALKTHNKDSEKGLNLTYGGDGLSGYEHSEETKERMRESGLSWWSIPENRNQRSEINKAVWGTEEMRLAQSLRSREQHARPGRRESNIANAAAVWESPEYRKKRAETDKRVGHRISHVGRELIYPECSFCEKELSSEQLDSFLRMPEKKERERVRAHYKNHIKKDNPSTVCTYCMVSALLLA